MGHATIAFPGGPGIRFRIDPTDLAWDFQINTSVTPTVGGRVVQVTGATLSDIAIAGLFGEDRDAGPSPGDDPLEHKGRSWRLAVRFSNRIREMMVYQSNDQLKHPTAVFSYPPENWKFRVYLKDFRDPDGGAITIRPDKFSHAYMLTLMVVQEESASLVKAGQANGVLNKAKAKAIDEYIGRISNGIGWKPTEFNGNFGDYYNGVFTAANKPLAQSQTVVPTNKPKVFPGGQVG